MVYQPLGFANSECKGNWNGMVSNLVSGEADIIVSGLIMCCRRTEAADYLWAINHPIEVFAIKG